MLTQQLAIKLKTLIHISLMTFNYDIRCIEICSLASNKKSTCMADLNCNVIKIKKSHETLTLPLKENGVMGAFLREICHFQRLRIWSPRLRKHSLAFSFEKKERGKQR